MNKNLTDSQIGRKRKKRRDAGCSHRSPKYDGIVLRRYTLAGEFCEEYKSIAEAVERGEGLYTYSGIYNCIHGTVFSHGGHLWRSDVGTGRGKLE